MPYDWEYINSEVGRVNPSTIRVADNGLTAYFRRYLLKRALAVFKWTLPETWALNYFEYVLYYWGYIAVFDTDKYGAVCQQCGLRGYNVFYQPTTAIISNPHIGLTLEKTLGVDAALIKLQPDFCGIYDIVSYYADKMALCAQGVDINLVNSKFAYVFGVENKQGAESLKKLYDQIATGNPAAFVDKSLFDEEGKLSVSLFTNNLKQNYLVTDLLTDLRSIENEFNTLIGIPNANTMKKERLVTDEVNSNNTETQALSDLWLTTLQEGIDTANELFNLGIKVERRFVENEQSDIDSSGLV